MCWDAFVVWCSYMDHSGVQVPLHLTEQLHPATAATSSSAAAVGATTSVALRPADADRLVSVQGARLVLPVLGLSGMLASLATSALPLSTAQAQVKCKDWHYSTSPLCGALWTPQGACKVGRHSAPSMVVVCSGHGLL